MQDPKTDSPVNPEIDPTLSPEENQIELIEVIDLPEDPIVEPTEVNKDLTDGSARYPDVFTEHRADEIVHFSRKENHFVFKCANNVALHIDVLNERTFRVRYSYNGIFQKDFSYAIDPNFKPCLLYTSPSPRDQRGSRMPSSA